MNIFKCKILTKTLPLLTAVYTILCTHRLKPPCDDCPVRVQWSSSVRQYNNTQRFLVNSYLSGLVPIFGQLRPDISSTHT